MLYAIYVPTARTPTSGLEVERLPSREQAGRCLLERNQLGAGKTWFLGDEPSRYGAYRPIRKWPDADETGYMRVFLRKATEPVPRPLDTPHEEWLVNPGGRRGVVVRLPWEAADGEVVRLLKDGLRVLPSGTAPAPAPAPRSRPTVHRTPLVAAPRAVCGSCFQVRDPIAGCGCPDSGAELVMEIQRPTRAGWEECPGCGKAVSAYARCGCS